jgi:DNA-binding Lrp family transcriptional regulator
MREKKVDEIIQALRKAAPGDMSIEQISKATGIGSDTVSKHVYALEMDGRISQTREAGRDKFYTIK